jgi:hypothetical protein
VNFSHIPKFEILGCDNPQVAYPSVDKLRKQMWCPAHKVERESSSDGGNFGAEMDFTVWSGMPCTQSARRKAGGCMRISTNSQDVPEHRMNKVKRTNRSDKPHHHSSTIRLSTSRWDFATYVPYLTTREENPSLRMPEGSPMWITINHCGSWVASVLSTGHDGT